MGQWAPARRGRKLIATVETDSCFWAQPTQKATRRQVFQKAPPPALSPSPPTVLSPPSTRCCFLIDDALSLLPQDGTSKQDVVCWFGSRSRPSTEARAWQLRSPGQCLRKEPVLGEARSWLLPAAPARSALPRLEHTEADLNPRLHALGCGVRNMLSACALPRGLTEPSLPPGNQQLPRQRDREPGRDRWSQGWAP